MTDEFISNKNIPAVYYSTSKSYFDTTKFIIHNFFQLSFICKQTHYNVITTIYMYIDTRKHKILENVPFPF